MYKTKSYLKFVSIIFVAGILLVGFRSDDKILLKLNLKKGDKFYVSSFIDITTNQTIDSTDLTTNQKMGVSYYLSIDSVIKDSGLIYLRINYDNINILTKNQNDSSYFATDQIGDTSNIVYKSFFILRTIPVYVKLTVGGDVKEVRGFDEIFSGIKKQLPQFNDSIKNSIISMYSSFLNADKIRDQFKSGWNIYPDSAIGKGDNWTKEIKMGSDIVGDLRPQYVLNDFSTFNAFIGVQFDVKIKKTIQVGNNSVKMELEGNAKGSSIIDRETGLVSNSMVIESLQGTGSMETSDEHTLNWPIKMTLKLSLNRTKK